MAELNVIQTEIYKALELFAEKSTFTEAVLAKKIRENNKIEGKTKAGLCFSDLEFAMEHLASDKNIYFSLHLNSANDLLIKKDEAFSPLSADARKRRLSSEKSMSILTNGDINSKKSGGKSEKSKSKRMTRKNISVNSNFEDFEE